MKTISKKDVKTVKKLLSKVISKRQYMPILECVLIEQGDNFLSFTGTDLEQSARIRIGSASGQVTHAGVVNAKQLFTVLDSIVATNASVAITLPEFVADAIAPDNQKITVNNVTLNGIDPNEYPSLPALNAEIPYNNGIYSDIMKNIKPALDTVAHALSKDETRFNLCGIHFEGTKDGVGRFVTTDGHRLACYSMGWSAPAGLKAIIPAAIMKALSSFDDDALCTITKECTHIVQSDKSAPFVSLRYSLRNIDGEFPDYRQVVKDKSDLYTRIASADLIPVLKQAITMVPDKAKGLSLTLNGDCTVNARSPELGDYSATLPLLQTMPEALTIGVNGKFLLDVLATGEGVYQFGLNGKLGPIMIKREGTERSHYFVLMPMRLA